MPDNGEFPSQTETSGSNSHSNVIRLEERQVHSSSNGTSFTYTPMTLSTEDQPAVKPTRDSKHILILGAGVSGLMTAWMLLDKGYRVTVIADDWAWSKDFDKSRMTSQIAGALWEFPPGGCGLTEIESVGSGWAKIEHYREWATQSFDFYNKYSHIANRFEKHGHSFGLQMTDLHQFFYSNVIFENDDGTPKTLEDEELRRVQAWGEVEKLQELRKVAGLNTGFGLDIRTHKEHEIQGRFPEINKDLDGQGLKSAYTHRAPIINTDKAMAYLMALVTVKGANLETQTFGKKTIKEFGEKLLKDHEAHLIVNATGLGARKLVPDKDVYPVRGAVKRVENTRTGNFRHLKDAYLVPAQRNSEGHPTKTIFIVPRNDDVLYVGSIIQPNVYVQALTPDSPEVKVMWNRAGDFMQSLLYASMVPLYPFAQGLRPFTKKNAKVRADPSVNFPLVHNYGHGGSGWTLGVGTARCVVSIVESLLSPWTDLEGVPAVNNNLSEKEAVVSYLSTWAARRQMTAASRVNRAIYGNET
ncbi:hypothetical protein BGZ98_002023 [Dissophora globulifera]|nr:hypothetical protein BGZ98_002023 [Dissophora globulifera]